MSVLDPQHEAGTSAALAARFERLPFTGYRKRLAAILATCFMIDGVDLNMLSFLLAPISADLGLSKGAAAWAASASFIGMGVGATCAGLIADRFGRRLVLVNSMLLWGTASLLTAFAWDLQSFLVFRIVTGIGLGAELPVAFALLAEFMPAGRRARLTGWVQVGAAGLVAFNALSLLVVAVGGTVFGWRAMFVVMFFTALFALIARRRVPESPRWYAAHGRPGEADAVLSEIERRTEQEYGKPLPEPVSVAPAPDREPSRNVLRELFAPGYAGRTLLAWAMWLVIMLAFYGITTWVGKLLVDRGMSVSKSILVGLLISAAGLPAAWLTGWLMDRVGRKAVLSGALVLVAAGAFAYGHAATFTLVVVAGAVMQFALTGVATSLYAYTPELFPTRTRGTGMGTASTAGRISAITGPLLVPVVLVAWGYTGTFLAFACCFAVGALLVLAFGPESRGRVLEEVSA